MQASAPSIPGCGQCTCLEDPSSLDVVAVDQMTLTDKAEATVQVEEFVSGNEDGLAGQGGDPDQAISGTIPGILCKEELDFHESANDFHKDLHDWVVEVSEVFHYRVFFRELIGQLLYCLLGPFCYPVLVPTFGISGLKNRGFWLFSSLDSSTITQFIIWAGLFASIIAMYFFDEKGEVTLIEKKFAIFGLLLRNTPVATKYAYMSTPTYKELNAKLIDLKYRLYMNLLTGWLSIPPGNFDLQAEIAFVTVVGSRRQRSQTRLKFLPWPRTEKDLFVMRQRVDITSKTMFFAPTGQILREKSRTRKAEQQEILLFGDEDEAVDQNLLTDKESTRTDLGRIRLNLVTAGSSPTAAPVDGIPQPGLVDEHKDYDNAIFRAAATGKAVPIQDLFLYILRGVMRSERAMLPDLRWVLAILVVFIISIPSFLRARSTGAPFGTGVASYIGIIGGWPSQFICYWSSSIFMVTGATDVWRRRALLRSCAAMLSVQREFRRHCPAEVDMLPILDLADVKTIAAWRKLRQLCTEWGKFYHVRIRAFTAQFFVLMLLIIGDLIFAMLLPAYTEISGLNLTSLLLTGSVCAFLLFGIFAMVFCGNEVNGSVDRHCYLLYRQRSLMLARRFGQLEDEKTAGTKECDDVIEGLIPDAERLHACADLISGICEELDFEGKVKPLTLLGLRLGWSLLSALNFIPLGIGTTVYSFCTNELTEARCWS
mmetsp:Transcript_10301/g.24771  ORF Transcript_10301/g.24771 Transcript_10301/m.24771 type:complete len:711 (+) Transcript_10301:54-2186(+)